MDFCDYTLQKQAASCLTPEFPKLTFAKKRKTAVECPSRILAGWICVICDNAQVYCKDGPKLQQFTKVFCMLSYLEETRMPALED
jgi:hypothetical protein